MPREAVGTTPATAMNEKMQTDPSCDWHHKDANEEFVCWSRMQAEAGQKLDTIIARKELERRAGEGLFLWGVGNAPAVITNVLARTNVPVRAVFSIMKSRPKPVDSAPTRIFVWRHYIDACGVERELPPRSLITSRGSTTGGGKRAHYALMCRSESPLILRRGDVFDPSAYRNVGGTGAPVGASQVTALIRRVHPASTRADYEANLVAELTGSYWVRLTDPVEISAEMRSKLEDAGQRGVDEWSTLVSELRSGPRRTDSASGGKLL
ncbi:hypothetical protein SAMN05428963_11451 [Consotaella salsifontis]|uniref:Uncharacterized protein n=1 Tax=Consotaella salsifontis TaxID=1365950 RepID=A0A1T4SV19_9HYPH|nr:hypothetical protein SAMN05428963_11451 [Consotaella salsifontis]